jgi:hypothetical protein
MPYLDYDQPLADEFLRLLESPPRQGQKEQEIQDFMEEHSELIPTTAMGLLHHGLNFNSVISKLPLGTSEIPDWVVLSKRSNRWLCTVIELKQPTAKFFSGGGSTAVSAAFEDALDQLRGNRRYVKEHGETIRKMLDPLIQPVGMKSVRMVFEHVLIYGRSSEKNMGKERNEIMLEREDETDFRILSYDSVLDAYKHGPRTRKNILRLAGKSFSFKQLVEPARIFGFLTPAELKLSQDQIAWLRDQGYDIDAWREGKLLTGGIDHKTVPKPIKEEVEDIMKNFNAKLANDLQKRSGG